MLYHLVSLRIICITGVIASATTSEGMAFPLFLSFENGAIVTNPFCLFGSGRGLPSGSCFASRPLKSRGFKVQRSALFELSTTSSSER
jgi:hypothetical protein